MAAVAFLPEEIILQIVTRLPVKSVGRCRCVSTRWRSLFSDPHFAKSHFQLAPKHRALIFQHLMKLETLGLDLSDTTLIEKESLVLRNLNSPFPFHHKNVQFLGSCNGLVAVRVICPSNQEEECFLIWNPSTGFFKKFPCRRGFSNHEYKSGFGYVSKTDEYILVKNDAILSSKTETWKPMAILPPGADIWMPPGVFFRDALHWLVRSRRSRRSRPQRACHMYAFDLEKEEFSIMQLPSALQTLDIRTWNHGVTREGCLYVMVHKNVYRDGELDYYMVEFWVMRDYGNNDSWTRSFGVKIPSQPARKHWYLSLESISVSETSALVRNRCPLEPENSKLLSTSHYRNEEENSDIYVIETYAPQMVGYEESLCRLD